MEIIGQSASKYQTSPPTGRCTGASACRGVRIISVAAPRPSDDPITRLQIELAAMNSRGRALYPTVFNRSTISAALDLLDGVEEYHQIPAPAGTPTPTLELARDLFCMMADEADLAGCA
jgi:hypothetical protein